MISYTIDINLSGIDFIISHNAYYQVIYTTNSIKNTYDVDQSNCDDIAYN